MLGSWRSSNATRLALRNLFIALLIVFILTLLNRLPGVERVTNKFQASIVTAGTEMGKILNRIFVSEDSLKTQLTACQEDQARLSVMVVAIDNQTKEISELRSLLNYSAPVETKPIAARIIARAAFGESSNVLIDQGENDGVIKGAAVVVGEGMLYGLVHEVRPQTSLVRLITHGEVQVPVGISGKKQTIGLTHGREGDLISMEFVPQEVELFLNDLVVTSGLDGNLPPGLIVGKVSEIINIESAPFQEILLSLLFDPQDTTAILVLVPQI